MDGLKTARTGSAVGSDEIVLGSAVGSVELVPAVEN
jgi:hypothetical protein